MNNSHPETYCPMPFMAASLESFDQALPCCVFRPNAHIMKKYRVHEFEDWWRTGLAELREDLLNGVKHSGCRDCWQEENEGKTSQRLMSIARYPEYRDLRQPLESPIFLMIGIGTHCNLKCIFCNPWRSSSVAQEYESRKIEFEKFGINYQGYPGADWYLEDQALLTIKKHIPQAKEIHFVGGEPLLKTVYLDLLDTVKNPESVQLMVNTSLDRLSDRWINTLKKFQSSVHVSVEAAGPLNNYVRNGSSWERIEKNLDRLQANDIDVKITHVLSRTSVWAMSGIVDFARARSIKQLHFHYLTTPDALQLSGATDEERKKLLQVEFDGKLANEIGLLDANNNIIPNPTDGIVYHPAISEIKTQIANINYDPDIDKKFWQYIDFLDRIRNQNFRSLIHD